MNKQSFEYHLTEKGWALGAISTSYLTSDRKPAPSQILKTVVWYEEGRGPHSAPRVWAEETVRGDVEIVRELEARYGPARCPFRALEKLDAG